MAQRKHVIAQPKQGFDFKGCYPQSTMEQLE